MLISNTEKELVYHVVELMQPLGPVNAKGMFGGHGIFLEGLIFGLVADRVLYLKADKESENKFLSKQLEAFSYNKMGKEFKMSYFQAPDEALEYADEMNIWANNAYSAALRALIKKRKNENTHNNAFK